MSNTASIVLSFIPIVSAVIIIFDHVFFRFERDRQCGKGSFSNDGASTSCLQRHLPTEVSSGIIARLHFFAQVIFLSLAIEFASLNIVNKDSRTPSLIVLILTSFLPIILEYGRLVLHLHESELHFRSIWGMLIGLTLLVKVILLSIPQIPKPILLKSILSISTTEYTFKVYIFSASSPRYQREARGIQLDYVKKCIRLSQCFYYLVLMMTVVIVVLGWTSQIEAQLALQIYLALVSLHAVHYPILVYYIWKCPVQCNIQLGEPQSTKSSRSPLDNGKEESDTSQKATLRTLSDIEALEHVPEIRVEASEAITETPNDEAGFRRALDERDHLLSQNKGAMLGSPVQVTVRDPHKKRRPSRGIEPVLSSGYHQIKIERPVGIHKPQPIYNGKVRGIGLSYQ